MSGIFENALQTIGHTPLVCLNNLGRGLKATVLAKLEGKNPAGSVKDRVGLTMIEQAERDGVLTPGDKSVTVIEPTSGNTGIALAMVCAQRGYPLVLTMPETMSVERRKILTSYGAKLILTEGHKGMAGAIAKAKQLAEADPTHHFMPQQFENPANPRAHFQTTGPEIWEDTAGDVDAFVATIGTGGTFTGAVKFLKSKNPKLFALAVEPEKSQVLTAIRHGETPKPGPHQIQGIGAGFQPATFDMSLADHIATVSDEDAMATGKLLMTQEGITCGISSGAALSAALKLASKETFEGKRIVVILPDGGDKYLSTPLFDI